MVKGRLDWQAGLDVTFTDMPRVAEAEQKDIYTLFVKMSDQLSFLVSHIEEVEANLTQHTIVHRFKEINRQFKESQTAVKVLEDKLSERTRAEQDSSTMIMQLQTTILGLEEHVSKINEKSNFQGKV